MTESGKGQKKYLWFGYGNYGGGHPTTQIGGGNIRDPGLFEELSHNPKTQASRRACSIYAVALFAGLMLLAMLSAWVASLIMG